jgi:hypothetical protein
VRDLALIAIAACLLSAPAVGQTTRLTLSGFSGALGSTGSSDHDQGYKESAQAVSITVDVQAPQPNAARVATLYVRANASTMGGGKPTSSVTWRRNDLSTWNTLTTSDVFIQSQQMQGSSSWSNGIWFRVSLDWVDDPPAAYSVGITFSLVVTSP